MAASTREPRKSRVVFSVCSRGRYTRNPSLDIYLLAVDRAVQRLFPFPPLVDVLNGRTPRHKEGEAAANDLAQLFFRQSLPSPSSPAVVALTTSTYAAMADRPSAAQCTLVRRESPLPACPQSSQMVPEPTGHSLRHYEQ